MNLIAIALISLILLDACFAIWLLWVIRKSKTGSHSGNTLPAHTGAAAATTGGAESGCEEDDPWKEGPFFKPAPMPSLTETFFVKPYVQLGQSPASRDTESIEILWHGTGEAGSWAVAVEGVKDCPDRLRPVVSVIAFPEARPAIPAHYQYRVTVNNLAPGQPFTYRVFKDDVEVFSAESCARKGDNQPFSFVAVGDLSNLRPPQKKVAYRMWQAKPDFIAVAGDIVYMNGRLSEYLAKFFQVYNNDTAALAAGAPILRSVLMLAAPGNHCVGRPEYESVADLDVFADLFGYFVFWSQPLNGPVAPAAWKAYAELKGADVRKRALMEAAGDRYPVMASFSFDYGDSHWVVLDSNTYMDWTDPALRKWLEDDLAASSKTWKFVLYHHPSFYSNRKHQVGQRMRLVSDIFQRTGVDVVFMGHVHTYERSKPLKFTLETAADGSVMDAAGFVNGKIELDEDFDGKENTRPNGIIYIVSGAGGAKLHNDELPGLHSPVMPFTEKVVGDRHSFTLCAVDGLRLTIRQIDEDGNEVDALTVTKG